MDVFCERGAFDLPQSRQILEAAREHGFPTKIHADEFENLGGASLAAELGSASADHLVVTSKEDIQALGKSDTVAVALPCTPFGLAEPEYTPAKEILDAGGLLAIATDINIAQATKPIPPIIRAIQESSSLPEPPMIHPTAATSESRVIAPYHL